MPRKAPDLTGQKFGSWLVLGRAEKTGEGGRRLWLCRCSCGAQKALLPGNLLRGVSRRRHRCAGVLSYAASSAR